VTTEYDWPALYELAWDGEGDPPAAGAGDPPAAGQPAMLPAVAGREKCTATSKQSGKRCGHWPVPGATVCKWHGGGAPQVRAAAERRVQEQQALALARKAAGEVDVAAFGDPFTALETALAHQHALALRLLALVEAIPDGELRYRGKMAEQLRGEVTAAQTALRDLKASAEGAMRLGLAERKAKISEARVDLMERALMVALQATGLSLDGQQRAREVLMRELAGPVPVQGEVIDD